MILSQIFFYFFNYNHDPILINFLIQVDYKIEFVYYKFILLNFMAFQQIFFSLNNVHPFLEIFICFLVIVLLLNICILFFFV